MKKKKFRDISVRVLRIVENESEKNEYLIFNVSKPDNSHTAWNIDMKFGTLVKPS